MKEPPASAFALVDEDIDLSDIPELDEAWFAKAELRMPVSKEAVSIRLDSDVLAAFKAHGRGYQTRMNTVLRKFAGLMQSATKAYRIYREDGEVGVWLSTDAEDQLVGAIEHCASLAEDLDNPSNWKWLILGLHNALQCACVCALRGEDTLGHTMLSKKSGKKLIEWHEADRNETRKSDYPAERLDELLGLYEKVMSASFSPQNRLPRKKKRDEAIDRLNILRNKFVHFVPQGWSIELGGMPQIVNQCADAVEHLAVTHPTFRHHLNEFQIARMKDGLARLRQGVANWATDIGLQSA